MVYFMQWNTRQQQKEWEQIQWHKWSQKHVAQKKKMFSKSTYWMAVFQEQENLICGARNQDHAASRGGGTG
jgi:hypothetical protein